MKLIVELMMDMLYIPLDNELMGLADIQSAHVWDGVNAEERVGLGVRVRSVTKDCKRKNMVVMVKKELVLKGLVKKLAWSWTKEVEVSFC